jgi:hypothetical protein
MKISTVLSPPAQDQSAYCDELWLQYCRIVEKQPVDQAAAIVTWRKWLRTFIPNKSLRSAIPLPKRLVVEAM